ncbi:lactate utilization protein [Paramaledivibacter caminithermalis]|jgi:hypothetical protein|uniref:Uncharacterized ACR, YkgG family COG1556 n=1 Tax=Paramaledivibacter caminithermalis (strain DSM 15212 / CIP 107654 / DViRD3) TaxID=1121301 RepID=A0A1M6SPT9_PARC5|nr:lactate utilization protein [Paramaledivibacter caminithermalis]SHK46637.1 Uncharacterised ACR, YkgG family COG1556 [Paramaledivibacter caminithermalis DSM 15212]
MNSNIKWKIDNDFNLLKENLVTRNYKVEIFENSDELIEYFKNNIKKEKVIGVGGSTTLSEIGLIENMIDSGYNVLNRNKAGLSREEKHKLQRAALTSDVFICSVNAISIDGQIINIDHTGNRVSAILYGPREVYLIIGYNKVCWSLDEAMNRARLFAAPLNAKRSEEKYSPPCLKHGQCVRCNSNKSICSVTSIMETCSEKGRIKVLLVKESLGF